MTKRIMAGLMTLLLVLAAGCKTKPAESPTVQPTAAPTQTASVPESTPEATQQPEAFDKQLDADVVVVGGGGAGISAAISAAQAGKSVVLIEKVGYLGGATMMSGGLIPAVGTKQQVEAGIEDDIEWFVRDMMRPNNYSVRQDLVYTVARQAKPTIEWLEEVGVKFSVVTSSLYYGQSNYRMHLAEGSGKGLTETMIAYLNAMDNVTVLLTTPGTGLAVENDKVVGVYAQSATDGKLFIKAENTILASSGFGANQAMIQQYIPEMIHAFPYVAPGATGEGILWGQQLGAAVANMGAYQGHAFYSEDFGASIDQGIANRGGIMVNINGVRFQNEYNGYSELSPHVLAQPDHHVYLVFDEANAEKTAKFADYQAKGIVITANTAEELAELTGMNAQALVKTFEGYQASIERGEDEFNRTKLPESFKAPFHAIKITGDLRHTQGGLVTDLAGHVLREDYSLISGLYAAGGVTESFSSEGGAAYMSGNGLLQAIIFGKIAGEYAASETVDTAKLVMDDEYSWMPGKTTPDSGAVENSGNSQSTADLTYTDGEYEGQAKGHADIIKVKVTVSGGKVTGVEVLEQNDTPAIYATAEEAILNAVVDNNGTGGVDVVAGATNSSKGLLGAVEDALAKAK